MKTISPQTSTPTASSGWPLRLRRTAITALMVLPPASQLVFLLLNDRDEWFFLFADDAYYYLGVAENLAQGNGSTFGGLIETNGYHPLWLLTLTALAFVARNAHAFVVSIVVLQTAIWIALVRQAVIIGRAVGSEVYAVVALTCLGVLAVMTGQLSFSGMESAIVLLILLVILKVFVTAEHLRSPDVLFRFGLLFATLCLARLDAIMFVAPLSIVLIEPWAAPLRRAFDRSWRTLGPTALTLTGYVVFNKGIFGTFTPVSGQAKSLGAPFFNTRPFVDFLRAGQAGQFHLWFGAFTLLLVLAAWLTRAWRHDQAMSRVLTFTLVGLVAEAFLLIYLTFATTYPTWAWYRYITALVAFCAALLVAKYIVSRLGELARQACVLAGITFAAAAIPVTLFSGFTHNSTVVEAATSVSDRLPPDSVLAMGDRAGLFGYLVDRPVLHLEGLVSDAAWLRDLEHGTAAERMIAEGVDYYVWYGPWAPASKIGTESCRTFREPRNSRDGPQFDVTVCDDDIALVAGNLAHPLTVWRFRPELNGS